jgi:hypothetical protein
MKKNERTTNLAIMSLLAVALLMGLSASSVQGHNVKGIENPTLATARVTSPTAATDLPIPIYNTGVSVACFKVRNTSPYDAVITAIGLELPGDYGDFNLVLPSASIFHTDSAVTMEPLVSERVLDFAFLTGPRFHSDGGKLGLHPSTDFTDMCVSGRFPAGMTIETMLNGLFVRFSRVGPDGNLRDVGIWENAPLP